MCDLSRVVGNGSKQQVVGFIPLMIFSISLCWTSEKQVRDGRLPTGRGGAEGEGEEEPGNIERMLLTLDLKKSMKLLHRSAVVSVSEGVCGFRR